MKTLDGLSAASGIARGITCLYKEKAEEDIPHYLISRKDVPKELERLKRAYAKAKYSMEEVFESSRSLLGSATASEIFKAHEMILEDAHLLKEVTSRIKNKLVNAEHAIVDGFNDYIVEFEKNQFHFAELAHDVIDVRNRLLATFKRNAAQIDCVVPEKEPLIITAKRLTPSMVLNVQKKNVLAFVTEEGGYTTHASILAKGFGVPVVFGVDVEGNIDCGDFLIVDGSLGKVIVNPDKAKDKYYRDKIAKLEKRKAVCEIKKGAAPQTKTGLRLKLKVNITTPPEMELVEGVNYDGVGLLRTEFLFQDPHVPPTEDEQMKMYKTVVERASGKPVTVRLMDIGGDKVPPYIQLPHQENPELGIRGARALEFFSDLYKTQMRAILRSSAFGDVRVLYPMVADISDLESYREMMKDAKKELRKEKVKFNTKIQEGVMIETPSAAIMADVLLENVDFANIGSNDLLQYTLASERGNVFTEKRYHVLHPSLVVLLGVIAKAGKKQKKEVCLCGAISSFEEFYPLLMSIGLSSFSIAVSKYDDIKCHLLYEKKPGKDLAEKFYAVSSTKKGIDEFFKKIT